MPSGKRPVTSDKKTKKVKQGEQTVEEVKCSCNKNIIEKTSNAGRDFYTCALVSFENGSKKGGCNFFKWKDDIVSLLSSGNVCNDHNIAFCKCKKDIRLKEAQDLQVKCYCGMMAVPYLATKKQPSYVFLTCGSPVTKDAAGNFNPKKCKFWSRVDEFQEKDEEDDELADDKQ